MVSQRKVYNCINFFVLCFMLLWLIWGMDRFSLGLQTNVYFFTWGLIGNGMPFVLLFMVFLILSNRLFTSFIIVVALGSAFYFVSFKKDQLLGKPVLSEDFIFFSYLDRDAIKLFENYIDIKFFAAGFVACVVVGSMLFFERRFFKPESRARLYFASFFACLIVGGNALSVWDRFYEFKLMRFSWNDQVSVLHAGVVSKIFYDVLNDKSANNVSVNYGDVDYILNKYNKELLGGAPLGDVSEKPDIVIIQSEAFSDPSLFTGVHNLSGLLPVYSRATEQGNAGYMKVPTFGGGTIRTEYEVLSGVPLMAYPKIQFPYMQLEAPVVDSLATQTKENGYVTLAIHGNSGSFWNRRAFFKKARFDNFFSISEFPSDSKKSGFFMSDESMTDLIIRQLGHDDKKKFVFAISIEAHGPYLEKNSQVSNITVPDVLSAEGRKEFQSYLYHIGNADAELGRLHDYLERRGRPYILVFYGDHLPSFDFVYSELSFKNGLPGKSQLVPWVIFTNVPGGAFNIPTSWSLGATVLDRAKLRMSPYFCLLNNFVKNADLTGPGDLNNLLSVSKLQSQGGLKKYLSLRGAKN